MNVVKVPQQNGIYKVMVVTQLGAEIGKFPWKY